MLKVLVGWMGQQSDVVDSFNPKLILNQSLSLLCETKFALQVYLESPTVTFSAGSEAFGHKFRSKMILEKPLLCIVVCTVIFVMYEQGEVQ